MFKARIFIELKSSILDPAGQAVRKALHDQDCPEVQDLRIGRYIVLQLDAADQKEAEDRVHSYCHKLLVNPIIESYNFDLEEASTP